MSAPLQTQVAHALLHHTLETPWGTCTVHAKFGPDTLHPKDHWTYQVRLQNQVISYLSLYPIRPTTVRLNTLQVSTSTGYTRAGLATFLYLYAATIHRRPFAPASKQSEDGKRLWRTKLRPLFYPAAV